MNLKFIAYTEVRVRYGETDQMGYCYYGNYAMYFEVGRVEALRSLGMSYRELEESGVMLPVSHFEVNYKAPAKYDDLLVIKTTISELKGPRLIFQYEILKENELIATASTTLVFVSKQSMRPISPPSKFLELIREFEEK
jgi:acyl-CoA thioester hydrolase